MRRKLPPFAALRAFEAAARHGNFKRAAEDTFVSPSAISHQVKALEEFLGVQLFLRDGVKPRLTEAGQEYYQEVQRLFNQLESATARVKSRSQQQALTIHLFPSLASRWLLPRLPTFQKLEPGIDIRLVTSLDAPDFSNGDIDVAIAYGDGHWHGLNAEFLHQEEVFLACHPELASQLPEMGELASNCPFPLIHCSVEPDEWLHWFALTDQPPPSGYKRLEFDGRAMVLDAARDRLGIALGRTPFMQPYLEKGELVKPYPLTFRSGKSYHLVYPRQYESYQSVKAFRRWLLREFHYEESAVD